jgi:hypothetical protein
MRLGRYLAAITCVAAMLVPRGVRGGTSSVPTSPDDIERARVLDQQGVRAFREGRYNDAIRHFEEALKLGGPSSELWNIARSEVKLDEPEAASIALERYLSYADLSIEDRAGALLELDELRRRPSTVTVASSPAGAFVVMDGKRVGKTPASMTAPAGEHTVLVEREGYAIYSAHVVARFGRAVIVDARLTRGTRDEVSQTSDAGERRKWFTASAEALGLFARLGSIGRPISPAGLFSLGYVALERESIDVVAGARFIITYDSWNNTVGAPALTCGLGGAETAAALALFAEGAVGYRPSRRLRIAGDVGFGFASELGSQFGGDVFEPTCNASTRLVPAGHIGADISYAILPALRLVLSPILLEVQPAFGGVRSAPVDASGPWIRVGGGLGLAVDL